MTNVEMMEEVLRSINHQLQANAEMLDKLAKENKKLRGNWKKVVGEIESINDTTYDGTNHFYKTAEDIKTEVIDIINKHLGEVEEWK